MSCLLNLTGSRALDFIIYLMVVLIYLAPLYGLLVFLDLKRRWHFVSASAAALMIWPVLYHALPITKYDTLDAGCGLIRHGGAMTTLGWIYFFATLAALGIIGGLTGLVAWTVAIRESRARA